MRKREEEYAIYIINNNSTIRRCADWFGVSKSTVHNYLSKKLRKTNKFLYAQVYKILEVNFAERHIRGGMSTRIKYIELKKFNKKSTIQSKQKTP